jgi:PPE-repeat protein
MPATYVTEAELRANFGIENLYSSNIVEEVCQTAQDLLNQFLWFDSAPVVGTALQNNVATVMIANPAIFSTGDSITLSGAAQPITVLIQLPARSRGRPALLLNSHR